MNRKSGVLMHISSLWGDYSIGDFGAAGRDFIDFLAECGFSYWQVLPLCPTDVYNSPYKSPSSFAGNPYFISLETLWEQGLLTYGELHQQKQSTPYTCEYARLQSERIPILKLAAKRVTDWRAIDAFAKQNPYIEQFCKFMAIKDANGGTAWQAWESENYREDDFSAWKFMQYAFFTAWGKIKQYANDKGIQIIGDMPIYVAEDSSDVWKDKHLFKLNAKNCPITVGGVPPDYFSQDGQLWGNPIYDWASMEKEGFRWWRDRIRQAQTLFDGVRIDHFRAIESFWEVPFGAKTAKAGVMTKGPGMKLIRAIQDSCKNMFIIAEDLGMIGEDVMKLLKDSGFPGMRVFQFAFLGDKNSPHLPHNYPSHSVAYTGTHDNNTLLGYLWALDARTRRHMLRYCGHTDENWVDGYGAILRTLFASHAGVVILPIQDLLGYGSDTRLNTPGKAAGNWEFRVTKEQLDRIDKTKFRQLNELYGRI